MNTGCYHKFLTSETTKSLGSNKSKRAKSKNCENVSHLEITEVVLIYWNNVNNDFQQDSRVLYIFIPNESFGQLLDYSKKILYL